MIGFSAALGAIELFLDWWFGEVTGILPARWRARTGRGPDLVAVWRPQAIEFLRYTVGGTATESVGTVVCGDFTGGRALVQQWGAAAARGVRLRLADARPLRRTFTLPQAAEPFLQQVVANELDRRTPWRADQAYFHAAVQERPEGGRELRVILTVLPRAAVKQAQADLAALGVAADTLELVAPDARADADTPVAALDTNRAIRRPPFGKWLAGAVCGATVIAALALAGHQWRRAGLEREVEVARYDAADSLRLADEVERLRAVLRFPEGQKLRRAPAVVILEDLSRLLPDDTWLSELHVDGDGVQIIGTSTNASRLLPLLEGSSLFSGAEFRSALVRAEGGGDRFHISVKVVPHVAP